MRIIERIVEISKTLKFRNLNSSKLFESSPTPNAYYWSSNQYILNWNLFLKKSRLNNLFSAKMIDCKKLTIINNYYLF